MKAESCLWGHVPTAAVDYEFNTLLEKSGSEPVSELCNFPKGKGLERFRRWHATPTFYGRTNLVTCEGHFMIARKSH